MVAYIEDTTYGKRKIDEGGINIVSFDYDDDSGFHCCQDEIFILFIQAGTTKEAEAEGLHACPFCAKRNGSGAGLTRHLALCAKKRAAANRPGAKK